MLKTINRLLDEVIGAPGSAPDVDFKTLRHLRAEELFCLLDLLPTPILLATDPSGTVIRSNSAGHALFKSHRDQNLSQSAPEDEQVWSAGKVVPFEKLPLQHAVLTGNCVRGSECELRFADGEVRHIAGNVDPLFAVDGSIRGSIGVFLDITRLRMLEQENRLLSREIAHRARNYVSLVQTLARQSLKSKLSRDDYDSFEARLVALGRSVTISLPGSEDAPTVELVVKASIEPLLGTASSRVEIQGPRVQLLPEDVTTLSMSVHELTTNACKYGALSNSQGRVSVSWVQPQGKDIVIIDWIERGGPPVVEPTRQGFGTKLLSLLMQNHLGHQSETRYYQTGLEHRLVLPAVAPKL